MAEKERWKPCPIEGYEELYEVSNLGYVRRCAPGGAARVGRVLKGAVIDGYPAVTVWKNRKAVTRKVHVLVATAFLRRRIGQEMVIHRDGDKSRPHADNLKWTTGSEKAMHAIEVLDQNHGEKVGTAVLTNEQVVDIRSRLRAGAGVRALGREYGVSHSTISNIKTGKQWLRD